MTEWCTMISVLGLLWGLCVGRSEGGGVGSEGGLGHGDERGGVWVGTFGKGITMEVLHLNPHGKACGALLYWRSRTGGAARCPPGDNSNSGSSRWDTTDLFHLQIAGHLLKYVTVTQILSCCSTASVPNTTLFFYGNSFHQGCQTIKRFLIGLITGELWNSHN